jgi:hypothetical protein
MTNGMKLTGKALTSAHDHSRKDNKRRGRRQVRKALRANDKKSAA